MYSSPSLSGYNNNKSALMFSSYVLTSSPPVPARTSNITFLIMKIEINEMRGSIFLKCTIHLMWFNLIWSNIFVINVCVDWWLLGKESTMLTKIIVDHHMQNCNNDVRFACYHNKILSRTNYNTFTTIFHFSVIHYDDWCFHNNGIQRFNMKSMHVNQIKSN